MIKMTQITENEVSGDNELVFRFPSNHFTLEEFDAWFAREARGFRAALISYGDIFIESKTKKLPKVDEPVSKKVTSQHFYLDASDIKYSNNSNMRYLVINDIQRLKSEGVNELTVTYSDYRDIFKSVHRAKIPISDLTQDSLQVTLEYSNKTHAYIPNTKTKWGQFFKKMDK